MPVPEARPKPIEAPIEKQQADKPQQVEPKVDQELPPNEEKAEPYIPPPPEKEDPADLAACFAELKTLGVAFTEATALDDGNGCGIDRPITVTSLGGGVSLTPEGTMRCETALQFARWTANVIVPSLRQARPDETLAAVNQASTYVCRKRNSAETGKISEHARGNSVDISGLTFKSGTTFSIEPRMQDSTLDGALQRAITAAACLYFTTVLDPGSDAAHETHLHLDIITRKSGYRLCW